MPAPVCLATEAEHSEIFILCRSRDRVKKDEAIVRRFEQKIEERLRAMATRCEKQRRNVQRVEREVGRMLGQNTRAARLFEVTVEQRGDGGAELKWKKIEGLRDWATLSAGCYLLRTNVLDWTDEELWKTYMQLTEAEAAFKIRKTDLSIRPIWHQKEVRKKIGCWRTFWSAFWHTSSGRPWGSSIARPGWAMSHDGF